MKALIITLAIISFNVNAEEYIVTKIGPNTVKVERNVTYKEVESNMQKRLAELKRGNAWMEKDLEERKRKFEEQYMRK